MLLIATMLISCAMFAPENRQPILVSLASDATAHFWSDTILTVSFKESDETFNTMSFAAVLRGQVASGKKGLKRGAWDNIVNFTSVEKFEGIDSRGEESVARRREPRSLTFRIDMQDLKVINAMMSEDFDPGRYFAVASMPVGGVVSWSGGEDTHGIRFVFTHAGEGAWSREVRLFGRLVTEQASQAVLALLQEMSKVMPGASAG